MESEVHILLRHFYYCNDASEILHTGCKCNFITFMLPPLIYSAHRQWVIIKEENFYRVFFLEIEHWKW